MIEQVKNRKYFKTSKNTIYSYHSSVIELDQMANWFRIIIPNANSRHSSRNILWFEIDKRKIVLESIGPVVDIFVGFAFYHRYLKGVVQFKSLLEFDQIPFHQNVGML
jgi:hypothetical protein